MANKNLNAAKTAKKDELYTQMSDIETELQHYWPHFYGKTVLCNCNDPYESNFFKYFALHFNHLGLKKRMCTCYNGSPIQGNELLLPFEFEDDEPKRIAHKVVMGNFLMSRWKATTSPPGAKAAEPLKTTAKCSAKSITEEKGGGRLMVVPVKLARF